MNAADRTTLALVLGLAFAIGSTACMDPDDPGNLVPATVEDDPSLPRIEVNGSSYTLDLYLEDLRRPGGSPARS